MSNFKTKLSLLGALLLRLAVVPLGRHSDCDNTFHWAKYLWERKDFLGFLGKAVPDAMPAFYPPLFYYIIFLWRGVYHFVGGLLWGINLQISIFPSKLITIYQSYQGGVAFNKLPAIFADFGCAFLIYKIALLIGAQKKLARAASFLFLFLPPYWYNSSHWGQVESIYAWFLLLGFYFALKEKFLWAVGGIACSILVKQSPLAVLPVFLVYILRKKKVFDLVVGGGLALSFAWILYFPFQPLRTLPWAINFYLSSLRGEITHLVCNVFNFWAFIFGFEQRQASSIFAGLPFVVWGYLLFGTFLAMILWDL